MTTNSRYDRTGVTTPSRVRDASVLSTALVLLALLAPLRAQPPNIAFSYLTQRDGLSSYRITSIVQDKRGFLWIGTPEGLNRFDGYTVVPFTHRPNDSTSISGDGIECLLVDRGGTMWIGTAGDGLNSFDDRTMRFTRYRAELGSKTSLSDNRVRCLFEDSQGVLWIGTYNGLNAFDRRANKFHRFTSNPDNPAALNSGSISCITEGPDGIVWIGTRGGLHAYNRITGRFTRYLRSTGSKTLSEDYITQIHADRKGILWVGNLSGVLNRVDPVTRSVTPIPLAEIKARSLLSDNAITSIYEDPSGILWIGVSGNGLVAYDRKTETIQRYRNEPTIAQSLSNNDVTCLYSDAGSMLWIGTAGGGCNSFYNKIRLFDHLKVFPVGERTSLSVTSFCKDRSGTVFVGTVNGGLFRYDPTAQTLRHEINVAPPAEKTRNSITALAIDPDDVICIGTNTGLCVYEPRTRSLVRHRTDAANPSSLKNDIVTALTCDRNGVFWVGTSDGGLHTFQRSAGTFTRHLADQAPGSAFGSGDITVIFEDTRRRMWIGTYDAGLFLYNPDGGSVTRYRYQADKKGSISSNYISAIAEDRNGTLWIGTDAGINALDESKNSFTNYTTRHGLRSDVIYGILSDDQSNIWISTPEGLCELIPREQPKTGAGATSVALPAIRKFDVSDGLQEKKFNRTACLFTRNKVMYFGGINGFNVFRPEGIKAGGVMAPPVVLTDFQLFNTSQRVGAPGSYLRESIYATRSIVLPYDQNVLSFEFSLLNFSNPEKNVFKSKLEGGPDKDWNTTSANRRFATYTNLEPGEYVFRVIGSNADGVWNNAGVALRITITPPWWRTIWAYIAYVLSLLSAIFGIIHFQRVRVIRKERQKSEMREAHLRAQAAEAQARALQAENERQEIELAKKKELETAYADLETSHRHLKETQQQLVHSEKMASLGQLTAGIAHEIKNPLNFVNNFSVLSIGLIKELETEFDTSKDKSVSDIQEYVNEILSDLKMNAEKINHHGKRADSIVRGMLLHSSGKSGERQPTEINTLLEESVNLAYHSSRANDVNMNVNFETTLDPGAGVLQVVPQEIMRVFLNIIQNAIHAVTERASLGVSGYLPTVWIQSVRQPGLLEITVRDNGKGIPLEVQEKVFEPFFTTKPTGEGTGLGLSISYDIVVKGHQGELLLTSEVGEGATFTIRLPVQS